MDTITSLMLESFLKDSEDYREISLLELTEPIFKLFIHNNSIYLSYLLQDRIIMRDNSKIFIKEIFISKSTLEDILKLIDKEHTIYETLNIIQNKLRIGKINNKLFKEIIIEDLSEIKEKIPKESLFLELSDTSKKRVKYFLESLNLNLI